MPRAGEAIFDVLKSCLIVNIHMAPNRKRAVAQRLVQKPPTALLDRWRCRVPEFLFSFDTVDY